MHEGKSHRIGLRRFCEHFSLLFQSWTNHTNFETKKNKRKRKGVKSSVFYSCTCRVSAQSVSSLAHILCSSEFRTTMCRRGKQNMEFTIHLRCCCGSRWKEKQYRTRMKAAAVGRVCRLYLSGTHKCLSTLS